MDREAIAKTNEDVVQIMIFFQLAAIAVSLLVALPCMIRQVWKGRFMFKIGLKSAKKLDRLSFKAVDRSSQSRIGSQSSTISIYFNIFCNNVFLRTLPLIGATGAHFMINILTQIGAIFPTIYLNPNPASNFKRAGCVAILYIPMIFILGIKNTPFALLGKSHERVNFIHRLLGPGVLLGGIMHAGFFVKHLKERNVPITLKGHPLTGFIALMGFLLLGLTSIPAFRSRFYEAFKLFHMIGFSIGLSALYFHVGDLKPFILVVGLIMGYESILTALKTSIKQATFTSLPGGITKVEVQNLGANWRAGQHVYLRIFTGPRSFEKHPFTIANAPAKFSLSGKDSLILMAKSTGAFTKKLYALGLENPSDSYIESDVEKYSEKKENKHQLDYVTHSLGSACKVAVEGPYGSSFVDMNDYETVVLFAGGSGFAYSMATLEHLVGSASLDEGITKTIFVMWALRDLDMVLAFSETLNRVIAAGRVHQMQIIMRIYKSEPPSYDYLNPVTDAELVAGRVDPSAIVQEAFEASFRSIQERGEDRGCGIGVGVCGPEGLTKAVRAAVASSRPPHILDSGGIKFHSESFGM